MNSLNKIKLSATQRKTLERYEVDHSTVMDFRPLSLSRAKVLAKSLDIEVIFWHPCKHCNSNIRTRNGDCINCRGGSLEFQRRHNRRGFCYLVHSPSTGQCKVGISSTMDRRIANLRAHRYAGANDWEEVGRGFVENCGEVEKDIRMKMGGVPNKSQYSNDGNWHESTEAVFIDVNTAWWHFIRGLRRHRAVDVEKCIK